MSCFLALSTRGIPLLSVFCLHCCTDPELPRRKPSLTAHPQTCVYEGNIGLVRLGRSVVTRMLSGIASSGVVIYYHRPFFGVYYSEGASEDLTGNELAASLRIDSLQVLDPRLWTYDWTAINLMKVPTFTARILDYVHACGLHLPAAWTHLDLSCTTSPSNHATSIDDFLRSEALHLNALHMGALSTARSSKTVQNYRNPAFKLLWFALSHRWDFPPTASQFALYLAKLRDLRNNVGALTLAKHSLCYICSINGRSTDQFSAIHVTAAIESVRRDTRGVTKKAAALKSDMVAAINQHHSFPRPARPPENQWEFALGSAISTVFKLLGRYDDAIKLLWDDNFCTVFDSYIRFYLHGRKNLQHGSALLIVARPPNDDPRGIYFLLKRAKRFFRSGHVLPHINRQTGLIDHSKHMPYGDYVIFLRSALVNIGVPEHASTLFAGHSARAGGASEAAAHGLHQEDIQHLAGVTDPAWMLCYNRRYLPEQLRVSRALGL